jgi:hypothetical protein
LPSVSSTFAVSVAILCVLSFRALRYAKCQLLRVIFG